MASSGAGRMALVLASALILVACEDGTGKGLFGKSPSGNESSDPSAEGAAASADAVMIERDVESAETFHATDSGLWDGRPSLGGVWVAHPDVKEPERVIIRNKDNGKFVIGALFRRELENPGPSFQVSSDAAESLSMLAGAPATLDVTALIREQVPVAPAVSGTATPAGTEPAAIEETKLDPVTSAAESAISAAEIAAATANNGGAAAAPVAKPVANAPAKDSKLTKPYLQIGIFSVEENANRTAEMLSKDGILSSVKKSTSSDKPYWRVIVGPAGTKAEQTDLLNKIKALGFADAYAVTG